jgi:diguanylate cyclase (GGDEF)-like protein
MQEDRQTILIVDDESMNFGLLSPALKDRYRILVAKGGEQALKIMERDRVDLVLLDILMPGMDGYEVLRRLKDREASKDIPVIFITSKSEDQDEARGLHLGAVDYIRKPFYLPIVQARVQTHLELKLKNEILTELVSLDGLTNIFNRRKFDEALVQEWKRAHRAATSLSLLLIDVDHFKRFNDTYGHAAGDACLRRIARAFKGCLKRPGDFLARYGGEEFIMLLPITTAQGAANLAETVRNRVQGLGIPHAQTTPAGCVTVSVGGAAALPGQTCHDPEQFLQTADRMLYAAKEAGRNACRLHDFRLPDQGAPA